MTDINLQVRPTSTIWSLIFEVVDPGNQSRSSGL
jgi:hypothetical protein